VDEVEVYSACTATDGATMLEPYRKHNVGPYNIHVSETATYIYFAAMTRMNSEQMLVIRRRHL